MTTPACHNFAGIATNRFLLGLLESAVNPGFVLIMSMWYTGAEQPLRLEAYYCTNGIATMFGGLIGYAVGHIHSGLPRWMYVFLIFGSCSILMGVATLLLLPDLPSTANFLREPERVVAVDRVAGNRQGVKNRHFKKYQAWQTLRDPKTWILFVMATGAQVPNSALTSVRSACMHARRAETDRHSLPRSSAPSSSSPSASTPSARSTSRSPAAPYNSSPSSPAASSAHTSPTHAA
jgi:MFS family permease